MAYNNKQFVLVLIGPQVDCDVGRSAPLLPAAGYMSLVPQWRLGGVCSLPEHSVTQAERAAAT